jgi:phosphoglycerate dehydrogenase-like enzyme
VGRRPARPAGAARGASEGLPRLRVVVRYGVGVDGIDLEAATDQACRSTCRLRTDEVANHAVALLLSLARKLTRLDRQTRSGAWDVFRVGPIARLSGQTVGLLGCGRIGSALARKLGGFDVRLLGCDPYVNSFPPVQPCSSGCGVGLRHHPPLDGRDAASSTRSPRWMRRARC